jgi:hypothetical protein
MIQLRFLQIILMCFLSIAFHTAQYSQVKKESQYLGISLTPQMQPFWCWAASAEMIMKYNNRVPSTTTQCSIAQNWINEAEGELCKDCDCKESDPCNLPISGVESLSDLFYENHFTSTIPSSRTTSSALWYSLKNQLKAVIDGGKSLPFIVIKQYRSDNTSNCSPSHILTVKGYEAYEQIIKGEKVTTRYLIVNDPQSNIDCRGSVDAILYGTYPESYNSEFTLCSYITNIIYNPQLRASPRMLSRIKPKPMIKADTFPFPLPAPIPLVVLGKSLQGIYSKDDFLKLVDKNENNTIIPIRYIQMDKILNTDPSKLNIDAIYYNTEPIYELIYKSPLANQYTVNRMQLGKYNWTTNSVSSQSNVVIFPKDFNEFKLDNKEIDWVSNVKNLYSNIPELPKGAYEKIKFPPFNYEFFHFYDNNRSLYMPVSDYPNLTIYEKPVYKNQYYNENDILQALQTKAKVYNERFRKK